MTWDIGQDAPDLLNIGQAARLLNIHPNSLRRWELVGKVKCLRIGPRCDRRFHRGELLELLKESPPKPRPQECQITDLTLNPKELVSLTEAAQHCCYSTEYLSLMARRGMMAAAKIGRNWVTTLEIVAEHERRMRANMRARRPRRNRHNEETETSPTARS